MQTPLSGRLPGGQRLGPSAVTLEDGTGVFATTERGGFSESAAMAASAAAARAARTSRSEGPLKIANVDALSAARVRAPGLTMPDQSLTPAEVAILESFVVPTYLKSFAEAALSVMLVGQEARIAHVGCRTGYPDRELLALGEGCSVVGVDPSESAIQLARNKAAALRRARLQYHVAPTGATELPSEAFSHALSLHPPAGSRDELLHEMNRLLYSEGQALVTLPLRGSFQELADLFREYALKSDQGELGQAVEIAAANRPTIESLAEEMEAHGFVDVDVDVRQVTLSFPGGRAFTEDPATRLMILPEQESYMGPTDFTEPLAYVNDAIGKYWSGRDFELSLVIGTATARKA